MTDQAAETVRPDSERNVGCGTYRMSDGTIWYCSRTCEQASHHLNDSTDRPAILPMGVREAEGMLPGPCTCPEDCHAGQDAALRAVSACIWCSRPCKAQAAYWRDKARNVGCETPEGIAGMFGCRGSLATVAQVRLAVLEALREGVYP